MLSNLFGFLFRPHHQWQVVGTMAEKQLNRNLPYTLILAALPAIAWYLGTTRVGWGISGEDSNIRISTDSALSLAGAFYVTMVISVSIIGFFIHWMSHTYGAKSSPMKGVIIAGFVATPVFVAGIAGAYPVLWFDLILATAAICYAVYLLYIGIPIAMDIPKDRGFLFASAVVAVAMVICISIMGVTVIFWEFIAAPEFIR